MADTNKSKKKAAALADRGKVMTLSTALDGAAWAAPVYYVFIRPGFYFFSNPSSRHITDALASGRAACAIFEDGKTMDDICGLQMTGEIKPVGSKTRAVSVIGLYIKKFDIFESFLKNNGPVGPDFFESAFNARLYRFMPQQIFYMENRTGFSTRVETGI
ncbi:MAG: hypothetical protein GXP53_11280 [Deltaproteobacteria bacterium]|nr:hypothetical protein [Deltaproteobacteria bacterium]